MFTQFNINQFFINSPLEQFEITSLLGFNAPLFEQFYFILATTA